MTTKCCVLETARGALERGFRSVVVADACASCDYPDPGAGPVAEVEMSLTSSRLTSTDQFLAQLP